MKNEPQAQPNLSPSTSTPPQDGSPQNQGEEILWLLELDAASEGQLRGKISNEEALTLVRTPFEQWPQELKDKVIPYLDLEEDD